MTTYKMCYNIFKSSSKIKNTTIHDKCGNYTNFIYLYYTNYIYIYIYKNNKHTLLGDKSMSIFFLFTIRQYFIENIFHRIV